MIKILWKLKLFIFPFSAYANFPFFTHFDYNYIRLSEKQNTWTTYSKVQSKRISISDISIPGTFDKSEFTCDVINKLYYLKAEETGMILYYKSLEDLIKLFDSGKCQMGQFWYWKVSEFTPEDEQRFALQNMMFLDNSLYWKEDIIKAIEIQKVSTSHLREKILTPFECQIRIQK